MKKEVTTAVRGLWHSAPTYHPLNNTALKMALVILMRDEFREGEIMELLSKNCGCQVWPLLWRLLKGWCKNLSLSWLPWSVSTAELSWRKAFTKKFKGTRIDQKAWDNRQYLGQEVDKWRSTERRRLWKEIYHGRKNFKSSYMYWRIRNVQTSAGLHDYSDAPETLKYSYLLGSLQAGSEG